MAAFSFKPLSPNSSTCLEILASSSSPISFIFSTLGSPMICSKDFATFIPQHEECQSFKTVAFVEVNCSPNCFESYKFYRYCLGFDKEAVDEVDPKILGFFLHFSQHVDLRESGVELKVSMDVHLPKKQTAQCSGSTIMFLARSNTGIYLRLPFHPHTGNLLSMRKRPPREASLQAARQTIEFFNDGDATK